MNELKALWKNESPTKAYFINEIENEKDSSLIGEIYIFWNSEDKNEANGKDRDNNNNPTYYEIPFGPYLNKLYEKKVKLEYHKYKVFTMPFGKDYNYENSNYRGKRIFRKYNI